MIQSTSHPRFSSTVLSVVLLLVSTAALSQAPSAGDAGDTTNQAEFSEVGWTAFEKFQQDDFAGAIAILEGLRVSGTGATNIDLALLGTLYVETGRAKDALEVFKVVAESETADPAVLFNAGRAALAAGEIETAERFLERSVLKMPVSPAARELGLLRGAQGRVTEAYRLLRAWVANNLGDTEARVALIAAGLKIDRAAEVGPLLDGLPQGDPKVDFLRAQHKSQMGDPDSAIALLEGLREAAPPEMQKDLYRLLADKYIDVGRSGDAVALLADRVERDPRLALLLAEGQQKSGDPSAAVETLTPFARDVLEGTSPAGPVAHQIVADYGSALVSAKRPEDAVDPLRRATEMRPEEPLAWKSLGDALTALGRGDEAATALGKFRELAETSNEEGRRAQPAAQDPGAKAIREAQQAMSRGEHQRALAVLRQEVALSPDDPRARILEIRLLLTLTRYDEALRSAEAAVAAFPNNPDMLYMRGVIRMGLERPEEAESDLRRAVELKPDHVAALNDLAVVLTTQGKKEEAKKLWEQLVQANPDNKRASENLERLRKGGGG